ncbi:hypothetical protein [Massilibacteroides vaginae]|uniref:hypothetical protein n=1 Tax=Massilibacteroides vaginae TaxID=1673718 RepID=UPI000A1CAA63|nr:hypothetical protein [Massilibacteroides vaginae]
MSKIESLHILIRTLSKAEKRHLSLQANLQCGNKVYMGLFSLFEKHDSPEEVYTRFIESFGKNSFEMAAKHLYRLIVETLLKLRKNQNVQTDIFNKITMSDILFERELYDDALTELSKAKRLASDFESDLLQQLIRRIELLYLSALDFKGVTERELIKKQLKINEIMKYTKNINMHMQLYDILRHRLTHKGYARSDKQKEDLNDLVLSELHLIANSSYKGFEANKLHLLFQATYYLNSGNYKLATRHYHDLLSLFDDNPHLLLNPPIYYLRAIHGVLDSLSIAGLYHEMSIFLMRLKNLEQQDYPSEFILKVRSSFYLYESYRQLNTGAFDSAKELMIEYDNNLFKKINLMGLEDQLKLYLNATILYLCSHELVIAKKYMRKIFYSGKLFHTLPSYKTARLVNLVLQAELGNYDFLENEISAIKRNIRYEKQVYMTEKLIFRFVQDYPLPSYEKTRMKLWRKYRKEIEKIENSKYERLLLKTFDFLSWIESKLTRFPFAEILQQKVKF